MPEGIFYESLATIFAGLAFCLLLGLSVASIFFWDISRPVSWVAMVGSFAIYLTLGVALRAQIGVALELSDLAKDP